MTDAPTAVMSDGQLVIDGRGVDIEKWAKLSAPFAPDEINLLPKGKGSGDEIQCNECGGRHKARGIFHVPYVGHARVTNRLNEVDPTWVMVPSPMIFDGDLVYMPVALTVLGITRHEVGCADRGDDEWPKHIYSDAITRAAMRFGVALDLWMKVKPGEEKSGRRRGAAPTGGGSVQRDPTLTALLEVLKADVAELDDEGANAWFVWKAEHDEWWKTTEVLLSARDFVMGLLQTSASSEPF